MKRLIKSNTIVILNLVLLCLFMSGAAEAIIIDHNCTDVSKIPEYWINQVKNMFLIHTGGSHGFQVPYGLVELEENIDSTYDVEVVTQDYPAGTNVFKVSRGLLRLYGSWTYAISDDLFWSTEAGLNNVRRTLDYYAASGIQVDAILYTWCWHFGTYTEAQVNDYFNAFETLEAEYPDVTFIYLTDTASYTGDMGYNRWLRNEQVRQYCRENDKVLFDFGELETWSADGTEQNTYYHAGSGLTIPVCHSDWSTGASNDWGHINRDGAVMKAKTMWWLMARLAGWDGVSDDGYNLTTNIVGNGTVEKDPDQNNYEPGTVVALTAIPAQDYVFESWSGDISGSDNPTTITMDSDKSITANFTMNEYTLTITAENGTVTKTPDQATYNPGDIVTLEAFPDSGHVFASWSGDLTGNTNPINIIMDSNKLVTANFAPESAQAPSAVILANPTSGEAPLAVNFDGSSSSDPDEDIISYEWDFEDDDVIDAQGVTTSYTYNNAGNYTVKLTVTDSQGLSDTATTTITVNAKTPDTSLFDDWELNCYNNVFNPLKGEEAIVEVTLKEQGKVSVVLYNTRGQEIKRLVDEEKQPETYRYHWDGKNDSGSVVSSGLYFVHIQAGDFKKTKKIVVVK